MAATLIQSETKDFLDVKYILEVYVGASPAEGQDQRQAGSFGGGGRLEKSFMLLDVDRVSIVKVPSTRRTWTLGLLPVKESSGYRQHRIFVSGGSGFGIRPGTDRSGALRQGLSGKERFDELKAFLDDYESRCADFRSATSRNSSKAPWLVFRRIWEGDAYVVDNVQISEVRDVVHNKFTAGYDLQMMTEFRLDYDTFKDRTSDSYGSSESASDDWKAIAQLSKITSGTNSVALVDIERVVHADPMTKLGGSGMLGTVAGMKRFLREQMRGSQVGSDIYDYAVSFASSASDLSSKLESASSGVGFYSEAARAVAMDATGMSSIKTFFDSSKMLTDALRSSISSVAGGDLLGTGAAYRSILSAVESYDSMLRSLMATIVKFDGNDVSPVGDGGSVIDIVSSGPSDNASTIASRFLGSRDLSDDVVMQNLMLDPWTMSDGRPLEPGVFVSIPSQSGVVDGPETSSILGTDLKFSFTDEDLEISGGSYALVSGEENVLQSLTNRSLTPAGQLRLRPQFGLPKIPELSRSLESSSYAASGVMSSYMSDPRVRRVNNVTIVDDGDTLSISLEVSITGGTTVPVSVPLTE